MAVLPISNFDIAVVHIEDISCEKFDNFRRAISDEKLSIVIHSRETDGAFASLEWFVPTLVIVYIGKSYFDGFLKEMGKEHYQKMKQNLAKLTEEVVFIPRIEPIIIATKGKIKSKNPYSLSFSIIAEANDGCTFKLLIPKPSTDVDYTEIIFKFLEFLNDFHQGVKVLENEEFNLTKIRSGSVILVHMDLETKNIERLDPKSRLLEAEQ